MSIEERAQRIAERAGLGHPDNIRDLAAAIAATLREVEEETIAQVLKWLRSKGSYNTADKIAAGDWKTEPQPRDSGDGEGAMPGNDTGKGGVG